MTPSSEPISWGLVTQKPEAQIRSLPIASHLKWQDIPAYIEHSIDYGNYARHMTYGGDGELFLDLDGRNSYLIIPDNRIDLTYAMGLEVEKYWRENFNVEGQMRLVCSQSELFYYPPGAGLRAHTDDHVMTTSGAVVARDLHRAITSILYLNEDYEGGELVFPKQGLSLKPTPGTLVMFPSNKNFPHLVKPITAGKRMSFQRIYGVVGANGEYAPPAGMTPTQMSCC